MKLWKELMLPTSFKQSVYWYSYQVS